MVTFDREICITGDGHIAIKYDTGTPLHWRVIDSDGRAFWLSERQVSSADGWHPAIVTAKPRKRTIES